MKAQLLKKLTNEELHLLSNVTHSDIIEELESRKPRKPRINIIVGDCFYFRDNLSIILIKVKIVEDCDWFICDEISIDEYDIDYYDITYNINELSDVIPIDANLYENILTLINLKEDNISKIKKQFNDQIRQLCQSLNQNQEKK